MDVQGDSNAPGAGIIAYTPKCIDYSNQLWWARPSGEGNYYFIVNQNSGLVLDIPGGQTAGNVPLIQWQQQGNDSQKWFFVEGGGSFGPIPLDQKSYYVFNKQAQKVLDVAYSPGDPVKEPGSAIICEQQTTPSPKYDQRWYFISSPNQVLGGSCS